MKQLQVRLVSLCASIAPICAALILSGCGTQPTTATTTISGASVPLHGNVHGGQQPISGATIQMYAAGTTGDGSAATPLITASVLTDATGGFNITGDYTCPSASALVYIVSTGGNPGLAAGTNNAEAVLLGAIGTCGSLSQDSSIDLDELTTVAAAAALAPFATSLTNIGSSSTDASSLAAAFALANQLSNLSDGTVPGTNVPVGATVPVMQLNTLANVLSRCINSGGGVANDGSLCGTFLAQTTPVGSTDATDTVTALINLQKNPALNTASLFGLVNSVTPFQPGFSTAPSSFYIGLTYAYGLASSPSQMTFGTQTLYSASSAQTLTLLNTGSSAISIGAVTVSGTNNADFGVYGSTCGATLAVSGACTLQVNFTPTGTGARSATISVASGNLSSPITIAVSGSGSAVSSPTASLNTSSLNFTAFGTPQYATLTNTGSAALTVSSVTVSNTQFTETDSCVGTLAAYASCSIAVTAPIPTDGTATLTVNDNTAAGSQTIALSATAQTPIMAVGLKKMVGGYTGPAMRIQRLSDNAQTDINFLSNGSVDTTGILVFLGSFSTPGYVVELYDQSGNGNNAVQTTVLSAPTVTLNAPTSITINGTSFLTARTVTTSSGSEGALTGPGFWNLPSGLTVNSQQTSVVLAYTPDFSGGEGFEEFHLGSAAQTTFNLMRYFNGFYGLVQGGGAWLPWGSGYYARQQPTVLALTSSPTAVPELYMDSVAYPGVSNIASVTLTGGTLMGGINSNNTTYANFLGFEVFAETLTQAQVSTFSSALIPRSAPSVNIVADGDSITEGHCATNGRAALRYAEPSLSQPADITNMSLGGTVSTNPITNVSSPTVSTSHMARLYQSGYRNNIYFLATGTNDIHNLNATGAATWANVQTALQDAVSLGYKTAVATIMHETNETTAQSNEVNNFNALLRAAVGGPLVGQLVDFAANSNLSAPAYGASNTCDGIHPNDSGYAIMGTIVAPALNQLIQ
jgi:lysophospholipase L1-like esterase